MMAKKWTCLKSNDDDDSVRPRLSGLVGTGLNGPDNRESR